MSASRLPPSLDEPIESTKDQEPFNITLQPSSNSSQSDLSLDDDLLRRPSPPPSTSFTFRSTFAGILIGSLLAFTNMYFGLQTGWISMMSLQSSLLGYAAFKLLPNFLNSTPLTVSENVLLQTTSTAVCAMPLTAGLIGIIPALAQLNLESDGLAPITFSPVALITWCFAIAFFGVFLAIPLREQVIIKEKLPFPSGTATAQILALLHQKPMLSQAPLNPSFDQPEHSPEPLGQFHPQQWKLLISTFTASILFSIISLAFPVLYALPIFDVFGPLAHDWSWWFTPSFAFVGQGIIMGFHTGYSMMFGMLFGWMILAPLAVNLGWTTPESVKSWILWPALSIMIVESLFSLLEFSISLLNLQSSPSPYSPLATDENDVPERGVKEPTIAISFKKAAIGFSLSCLVCVLIMGILFKEIKWWATVVALILASIFSLLGVRALGETDLNPVSSIAKISQLVFGVLQPQNLVANLIAGGISEAGAMQSGELMQDFKTAQLHGVDPASMFYGQMIGSFVSVFVSSGAYILYSRTYTLPSNTFPVPTAAIWLSLARLLNDGELPKGSRLMMVISGFIFFIIGGFKLLFKRNSTHFSFRIITKFKHHPSSWFLPSGIAFALGMINTPSFSMARFIGGVIAWKVEQRRSLKPEGGRTMGADESYDSRRIWLIIVATGFVLGEGFGSIFNLILKSFFQFKPLSCWGCGLGGGGYCGDC
ncbi:uncharacterized protein PGTG_13561 [Puccinia graminis f. sp. tritici CRL 75-36-700-3]|uniref:Oligopeptide transporter n=1 Tax=Puccinia graminis f. sp. tritici (strain CRL 75-36-700-3 / race SCCL) TaxID=418459 RepID=E3KTV1_PUCGT|nr:uncharacterized protein PGTG_13561 [Puccinia graminis f. sp. tritici CRL 75-36-700-3]EFP87775.1 hypothetical protein PGTG_13561 [Puccinia graminis f. sp. tritici CRL 75-36-700-3]